MAVERWIVEAQRGDASAFNQLVSHYQSTAYHVAYQQLHNSDDALDACQEAMLSAWRAISRFDGGPPQFRAWLLRIVVNAARDRLRFEGRRPHQSLEIELDGQPKLRPLPAPGQSPEEYAETGDLRALLEQCLAALSEDHRTIILLDQAGLGYPEIADVLGVEVGTVKSRLSRARAHMRELLGGSPVGDPREPREPPEPVGRSSREEGRHAP